MAVAVPILSLCINFKMIRLFYCKFFNLPYFNAQFEKPDMFYKPLTYITVLSIVVYLTPLIIVDIIAFFNVDWGFQLLINCIESCFLSILLLILCLIELFRLKKRLLIEDSLIITTKKFENSYSHAMNPQPDASTLALIQVDRPQMISKDYLIEEELRRKELKGLINRMNEPNEANFLVRSESYKDFREFDQGWAPDKEELALEKCITFP